MSLLTLRSTNNNNGSNVSESAANFSNHFKEGIVISPGDTFELVSMSINKLDKFEIIQGVNDTFYLENWTSRAKFWLCEL